MAKQCVIRSNANMTLYRKISRTHGRGAVFQKNCNTRYVIVFSNPSKPFLMYKTLADAEKAWIWQTLQ